MAKGNEELSSGRPPGFAHYPGMTRGAYAMAIASHQPDSLKPHVFRPGVYEDYRDERTRDAVVGGCGPHLCGIRATRIMPAAGLLRDLCPECRFDRGGAFGLDDVVGGKLLSPRKPDRTSTSTSRNRRANVIRQSIARSDILACEASVLIRREQMDAILDAQDDYYARRLLVFFRSTIREQTAQFPDRVLLEIIRPGVSKARRYGIRTDPGVKRFVGLMILVAPTFDEVPEVQQFLRLPDLDPDLRIKILSDLLSKELQRQGT